MDPDYLGMLVMVGVNKRRSSFKPSRLRHSNNEGALYYQMFRGKGGEQ